jgi:hypothetical protein
LRGGGRAEMRIRRGSTAARSKPRGRGCTLPHKPSRTTPLPNRFSSRCPNTPRFHASAHSPPVWPYAALSCIGSLPARTLRPPPDQLR